MVKLKDINDKTELILVKSKRNVKMFAGESIHVGCTAVEISSKFINHGVIFEQSLFMQSHVNTITGVCYFYLGKTARIRRFLDKEECNKIVDTFIISELDYCASIKYGHKHIFDKVHPY